ncbi:hypothetical protein F3P66_25075 (plasmid) [Agrobacterium fabrum]|uniref:Uncharacterized protein n=1 Tax=Agrobacterium fabrum (strain C58 / ATCC 33970) TaxID=176299 RepID=Q8U5W0_AGRFC|nr:conserved hypothetical protein [Agrobacterium fabrum str. C58]KJX90249.1 hypothetical protein SY94_5137 [Agrobacterium tumefaciens]QRM62659.1 hypothetical protein F3P66_25075 [Agrobacterium fabrum]TRB28114.1 hypothetical protein EXN51_15765 [Agrobacterium fabrum]
MVTYFRYSKPKYSVRTRLVGAVLLQLLGTGLLAFIFCHLDTLTAKPTITLGQFLPCLVGGVAGFHSVAFRRPATDGQLSLVATSFLAFGIFHWLASYSLPDLLLARLISGFGLGVVVARAFRRGFLENPVVPRVR